MTNWRPASFRGVLFSVMDKPADGFGRRVVEHEVVDGDGFTEDTGPLLPSYTITAAIIGDDYLDRGAKLREALNTPGPGVLVHPTLGRIMAQVGTVTSTTVYQRIDYQIEFRESGMPLPPEAIPEDTAWKWTEVYRGKINGAFTAAYSVADQAVKVVTDAVNTVNEAAQATLDAARNFASPDLAGEVLASVESLAQTADATVRAPADLCAAWLELVAPLSRAGHSAALAAFYGVTGPVGSPASVMDSNRDAIATMARGALAAVACDALIASLPPIREDAEAARDLVAVAVQVAADEATDPDVWRAAMDARDNMIRVASHLILTLPRTRVWTPSQAVSVFEASQAIFGDGSQVDDILSRNPIVNPLWVSDPIRALLVA